MRSFLLIPVLVLTVALAAPALGRGVDLPIRYPWKAGPMVRAPAYQGDVFEIRLRPGAAAIARRVAQPAGARVVARTGVAAVDAATHALGAWLEPEFRGETVPDDPVATDFTAFYLVHLPAGIELPGALARYRPLADVASVSPIALLPVASVPNDSLWAQSYWLYQASRRDLHAPEAWDVTTGDTSIVVAILDTGILPYHPDLGGVVPGLPGQLWTNWAERGGTPNHDDDGNGLKDDTWGWDFVDLASSSGVFPGEDWRDEDNDPNDFAGHGTAVAGVAGALTNNAIGGAGVAPKVRLMALRMGYLADDTVGVVRMDFAAKAIRYATRMGASVINCSWQNLDTDGLGAAVTEAVRAGVAVVVASGNSGLSNDLGQRDDVLSVGATDANDVIPFNTNIGPTVDVMAPGKNILFPSVARITPDSLGSRQPSYGQASGTSFSAPMASAAIALLQADRRGNGLRPLHPMTSLLRLRETADDLLAQNPGYEGLYGGGRLNLLRALTEAQGSFAIGVGGTSKGSAVVLPGLAPRVAFVTTNSRLVIVDAGSGDTVATAALPGSPTHGLAAADLGNGRGIGLFVATTNGRVAGFAPSGAPLGGWPVTATSGVGNFGGPALGDLDGDGELEIVCGSEDGQVWAWHASGSPVQGFPVGGGAPVHAPVALGDLDGQPGAEIVAAATDGTVSAWRFTASPLVHWPRTVGADPLAPAIDHLGRAGGTAVLVAAGQQLHAFRPDGSEPGSFPVTLGGSVVAGADPALGDLNGDGSDETVIPTTAPDQLEVRDSLGASLGALGWPRALSAAPIGAPLLGPLSPPPAGSAPDLLVMLGTGLFAATAATDSLVAFPKPGAAGAASTLADIDHDGRTEVIAGTGAASAFYVYDAGPMTWRAAESAWPTERGNFARTGNQLYAPRLDQPPADVAPPGRVLDLSTAGVAATGLWLRWSAPADPGPTGRAASYQVFKATFPLDSTNFGTGKPVNGAPVPAAAGAPESLLVAGLSEGVTYWFALRSRDQAGNVSGISNIASATTAQAPPAAVTDLRAVASTDTTITLVWTATGDDGNVGRPDRYIVRADVHAIDEASWPTAPREIGKLATVDAGGTETLVFGDLVRATRYFFALKAVDKNALLSPLSNDATEVTRVGGPLALRTGIALAPLSRPSRLPVALYWQAAPGAENEASVIRIYDLGGRLCVTLHVGPGPGGVGQWNGRDDDGNAVPAGLYFARLSSGSLHAQTRLVLLP